jgi:lipopolysaccharide export system permease protein
VFAFGVSLFSVFFSDTIVPLSTAAYNNIVHNEIEKNARPVGQEHIVIINNFQGTTRLTYARRFDSQTNSLTPVTIQEFENNRLVRVEQAEKATLQNGNWVMFSGIIHDLNSDADRSLTFKQENMPIIKQPEANTLEQKQPDEMTVSELKQRIAALHATKSFAGVYELELYQRLSIPLASVIFALLGAPLGISPHRSSSSVGLGLSILIIFIYYLIMMYSTAMAQSGFIPSVIAAWIPDIVGFAIGALLLFQASRR